MRNLQSAVARSGIGVRVRGFAVFACWYFADGAKEAAPA
jgi:hypothetical protein